MHEDVEAFVGAVVNQDRRRDTDEACGIGHCHAHGAQAPPHAEPRHHVQGDEQRATPPLEGERLLLLLIVNLERVVVLAELVMHQRMRGEHLRRQPRAVQPVAMVGPFEETGLDDADGRRAVPRG